MRRIVNITCLLGFASFRLDMKHAECMRFFPSATYFWSDFSSHIRVSCLFLYLFACVFSEYFQQTDWASTS